MPKYKYYDIEQGSEEWFDLRLGVTTSSHFSSIMAHTNGSNANAKFGDPAKKYAMRVALEGVTKRRIETFSNSWMERGVELEDIARKKYEIKTKAIVDNGGFFCDKKYGTSPDGLLLGDVRAGIEIKSVAFNTHFDCIQKQNFDTKYKWQIQGQIWLADLAYVDFVSFCPDFPPNSELFIHQVMPDKVAIDQIKARLIIFDKLVDEYKKLL